MSFEALSNAIVHDGTVFVGWQMLISISEKVHYNSFLYLLYLDGIEVTFGLVLLVKHFHLGVKSLNIFFSEKLRCDFTNFFGNFKIIHNL